MVGMARWGEQGRSDPWVPGCGSVGTGTATQGPQGQGKASAAAEVGTGFQGEIWLAGRGQRCGQGRKEEMATGPNERPGRLPGHEACPGPQGLALRSPLSLVS